MIDNETKKKTCSRPNDTNVKTLFNLLVFKIFILEDYAVYHVIHIRFVAVVWRQLVHETRKSYSKSTY